MNQKEIERMASYLVVSFSGKTFSDFDDSKMWLRNELIKFGKRVNDLTKIKQTPCENHVDNFVEIVECNDCNM